MCHVVGSRPGTSLAVNNSYDAMSCAWCSVISSTDLPLQAYEIHKFGCGRRGISIEQPMRQLLQRRPSTRVCNVLYSNWTSALQAREQLQLLQLQLTMRLLRLREFESDSASMYWRRLWRQIAIGSACLIGIGHNASASPTEKNTRDTLRRRAARPPADSTDGRLLGKPCGDLFVYTFLQCTVCTDWYHSTRLRLPGDR